MMGFESHKLPPKRKETRNGRVSLGSAKQIQISANREPMINKHNRNQQMSQYYCSRDEAFGGQRKESKTRAQGPSNGKMKISPRNEATHKKRPMVLRNSSSIEKRCSQTGLDISLPRADGQLFGENHPTCQMIDIGFGVFCKAVNVKYAAYSSLNARQCARRMIPGVFRLNAILQNTMSAKSTRDGEGKKYLDGLAILAIIVFAKKQTRRREWPVLRASQIRIGVREKISQIKKHHRKFSQFESRWKRFE